MIIKKRNKRFYNTKQEIEESFKTLTLPNSSELIKHFNGEKSNVAFRKK